MSAGVNGQLGDQVVVLFTEAEHVVLTKWFRREAKRRSSIDAAQLDRALAELGIPDHEHDDRLDRLDVAVARILLETDEDLLPNWWHTENDGTVISSRELRTPEQKPRRKVALRSQHILTINWADSGPGFSWPEAYRLVWVPGYERYVVTLSSDSGPHPLCTDAALGSFTAGEGSQLEAIGELIKSQWYFMTSYEQEAWECVFGAGLVSEEQALAWRAEVWPEEEEEEEA